MGHPLDGTDGRGGIRTLETVAGLPVFETGSFNHSDTRPQPSKMTDLWRGGKGVATRRTVDGEQRTAVHSWCQRPDRTPHGVI